MAQALLLLLTLPKKQTQCFKTQQRQQQIGFLKNSLHARLLHVINVPETETISPESQQWQQEFTETPTQNSVMSNNEVVARGCPDSGEAWGLTSPLKKNHLK